MIVNWGGLPDVKGWEDIRDSAQRLLTIIYNKDKEGAWRMNVNVELCEAYDSDNDDCDGYDNESIRGDNDMSEEDNDSDYSEEGLSDVSERDDGNSRNSDE